MRITNTIDSLIQILTTTFCTFSFTDVPTVSVSDVTYVQDEATRTVAYVPESYTFYKWQYKSTYGVLIRELDGGINGVLTLSNNPDPVEDRYQDSGEYEYEYEYVGNGIVGRYGKVEQT
jgi:hypothetical protein